MAARVSATEPAAPTPHGVRFGTRLAAAMLLVVLGLQAANLVSVRYAVSRAVGEQLHRELEIGHRVWEESFAIRLRQLATRVQVVAEDFGFREAVATADPPTLASALANAAERVGARHALLLDPEGAVLARRMPENLELPTAPLPALLARARAEGVGLDVVVLGEEAVSLVLLPVFAPQLVGWVAMGVPLGEDVLAEFSRITTLEAGLLDTAACRLTAARGRLAGWTPPQALCTELADAEQPVREYPEGIGPEAMPLLALRLADPASPPVHLILGASREVAMRPFAPLDRLVLGLGILSALIAVALAALLSRRVSQPVRRLAAAAARIRRGDYGALLPVRGRDELAALAEAFNLMQRGIAEREERIVHQASHDALTGLPNRERALLAVREALNAAARDPAAGGGLLKLDIRRFREINDLCGHAFGDRVLVHAAQRLRRAVREQDLVARIGSNEFLVLLAGIGHEGVHARAERLVEAMQAPLEIDGTSVRLDVAVGLVLFPDGSADDTSLVRRADVALAEAKRGQRTVVAYEAGQDERHLRRLTLLGDLRTAIARSELHLVFQPKVQLATGAVPHAEALLRWTHPRLGRIGPDEFIPLAERGGLIGALTGFVLENAIGQVARWRETGIDCGVAVNLSALDLGDAGIADRVLEALKRHRVPPARLIVEVTESAVMEDLGQALDTLHRLRRMGVKVAVDDFGTGQSSLAQLKRLPIDELKIDRSFVTTLLPGSEDEQIVLSIIRLAHALSLSVVSEGIESAQAVELLRTHGCEYGQGYHYARPLPAEDFAAWYKNRPRTRTDGNT